ncbi:winged helix-turn-helix domain-containing protein [Alteromonas ponticola]|uniref:Response regulator transcription factor n=1 Tax=Alteromonas ponticola TaxID=2720613 RepID=A0ABX1R6Y1_9ALTE|nr:winged helix-turn-helix domain-containing protein [Alteromonas ponticola]NMH61251.1 response regulator transcription factor [Alteromonas ponticola]
MSAVPLTFAPPTRTLSNIYGDKVVLSAQCAALLSLLLEDNCAVVTRSEIRRRIWNHGVVSEDRLNHLICRLRKEMNALPGECAWQIETIPKLGYQLKINEKSVTTLNYWVHRCRAWFSDLH